MKRTYTAKCAAETEAVGCELARELDGRGIKSAFIALEGDVGVGKTVFTRGFASYFGIRGIKSPTYTIVNEHRGEGADLYHFDLYRITGDDDLYSIGFDEYLERRGFCLAEWSERLGGELPSDALTVRISKTDGGEDERIIEITYLWE